MTRPRIQLLSSALLDDRKILYTALPHVLAEHGDVGIWATSARDPRYRDAWSGLPATVDGMPEVLPFREPYAYLRHLNDFAWDYRLELPSRESFERLRRSKAMKPSVRALKAPARALAWLGGEELYEKALERVLVRVPRSPDARARFVASRPSVVVATGPNRPQEPGIIGVARELGIPTLAAIHSWDNLSTKNRMVYRYDGYLVWSQRMRDELVQCYPDARRVPVYVVGAPQFDVFFQPRFHASREEFCRTQGLRPEAKIIVFALGSPNLFREHHAAIRLGERIKRGELGDVQLLVRPHPQFDDGKEAGAMRALGGPIHVQRTGEAGKKVAERFQDEEQIREWVNTFRHADVVVNLSSTVSVDAAILDKPVVNLDYDPEPGAPNQALIKDVNHLWTHFKPIAESGGVWLVDDDAQLFEAVKTYLARPELHREQRRWIVEYVCGTVDGRAGERWAEAILEFVRNARDRAARA
jgi:hypothetical protein